MARTWKWPTCPTNVSDSATPWTVARQAPLSMGFSRQEEAETLDGHGHTGWWAWHLVSTFPVSGDTIIARAYHPLREEESLKRQSHRASLCVFLRRKNQHCRCRIPNRALATPKFWRISRPVYFLVVYSKGRSTSSFTKTIALLSPSEQFIGNNN